MKQQEIFDQAVGGVLNQGAFSANEDGDCLYRGPNGLKCGVGHLIPDDRYDPSLEGTGADTREVMLATGLRSNQMDFARSIQSIHDDIAQQVHGRSPTIATFADECRQLAKDRGLKPTVIDAWEAKQAA